MNLVNTFARIKKLFSKPKKLTVSRLENNEHLARDIGLEPHRRRKGQDIAYPDSERLVTFESFKRGP